MSQIKIKNFGLIKAGFNKNDGFMDIRKVTTFIGNQGTGKSSVAKLFSTFSWLEKSLYRLKEPHEFLTPTSEVVKSEYFEYQGLAGYFSKDTHIEYRGSVYNFYFKNGELLAKKISNDYQLPKIMYVPAERNLLSVINSPEKLKYLPRHLYTFIEEFERSQQELDETLILPTSTQTLFEYQKQNKTAYIKGEGYKIKLAEASSGLQSLLPLYLVSRNLALSIDKKRDPSKTELSGEAQQKIRKEVEKILADNTLSEEVKNAALQVLSSKFRNTCFLNIVEEIEQNLFPSSQKELLFKLIEFANLKNCNQLMLTTHSPYIINYLTLAAKASAVLNKINKDKNIKGLRERLEKIVPINSCIAADDLIVYTLKENGTIEELATYDGLPSDNNYLNEYLADTNQLFDELLDIEEDTNQKLKRVFA